MLDPWPISKLCVTQPRVNPPIHAGIIWMRVPQVGAHESGHFFVVRAFGSGALSKTFRATICGIQNGLAILAIPITLVELLIAVFIDQVVRRFIPIFNVANHDGRSVRVGTALLPLDLVDRVYVANRGLLDIGGQKGFEEISEQGSGLLQFYMHMLNFLLRENGRRRPRALFGICRAYGRCWKSFRARGKDQVDPKAPTKQSSKRPQSRRRAV
jgi:hypothetical protein